jgi:hypothetical protein
VSTVKENYGMADSVFSKNVEFRSNIHNLSYNSSGKIK